MGKTHVREDPSDPLDREKTLFFYKQRNGTLIFSGWCGSRRMESQWRLSVLYI
jgi:hypothetical protein